MNVLEKTIHSMLEHKPLLRRWTESFMSLVPVRLARHQAIPRIFPNYFFGFHDKTPFSACDRYLLCHKLAHNQSDKRVPKAPIAVGYLDLDTEEFETSCWNYQQGSSLQWQKAIALFNSLDNQSNLVANRVCLQGQMLAPVLGHISHCSANGHDFRSLADPDPDPDYSYPLIVGHDIKAEYPVLLQMTELEKDMRPRTTVSLQDIKAHPKNNLDLDSGKHYFSHALFSPDSQKIAVAG